jgi:hypothetical protein
MIPKYTRVELITAKYEKDGCTIGMIGYVIECYPGGNYEVEFSGDQGVTLAQIVARDEDLIVVSETQRE